MFRAILKLLKPTPQSLADKLTAHSSQYFFGYQNSDLKWNTTYGLAPFEWLTDSHGLSHMPNIECKCRKWGYSIQIGFIEGISMYGGGKVRIRHFALKSELSRHNLGRPFLESIIYFFKKHNAVSIEFHENHSTKINHYRIFFNKMGIPEIQNGVWSLDLYAGTNIPKSVSEFQKTLIKPVKYGSAL